VLVQTRQALDEGSGPSFPFKSVLGSRPAVWLQFEKPKKKRRGCWDKMDSPAARSPTRLARCKAFGKSCGDFSFDFAQTVGNGANRSATSFFSPPALGEDCATDMFALFQISTKVRSLLRRPTSIFRVKRGGRFPADTRLRFFPKLPWGLLEENVGSPAGTLGGCLPGWAARKQVRMASWVVVFFVGAPLRFPRKKNPGRSGRF